MIRGTIAVVAAIVVGGCSGGEQQEQLFTLADATRITNVRPVSPGWTWPQNPEKHVSSSSQREVPSTDPLDVKLTRQTADLVSLGDAANKWEDADKVANLYAQVFASAAPLRIGTSARSCQGTPSHFTGWGSFVAKRSAS